MIALVVAAAGGCADRDHPTAPPARLTTAQVAETTLVACPVSQSQTGLATLGVLGGTIRVGDVRMTLPAGALTSLTTFVLTVPAGDYLEVEVHALGLTSFLFSKPATITIDYGRCGDVAGPLRAWYVDSQTKALLEDMGGTTDTVARTHTFQTKHLSGYAIAN